MTTSTAPVGVFDLSTIGIEPSSSHTVGPMKAAAAFAKDLRRADTADSVESVRVGIFGSLTATGRGHGTFTAVLLGLDGAQSARIDSGEVERRLADVTESGTVSLGAGATNPLPDRGLRAATVDRTAKRCAHASPRLYRAQGCSLVASVTVGEPVHGRRDWTARTPSAMTNTGKSVSTSSRWQ